MFHDFGYMMGMHMLWWLFWLLVIGALAYSLSRPGGKRRETPHELLRRRLAAGEISPQDYEQRKGLLDRDAGSA